VSEQQHTWHSQRALAYQVARMAQKINSSLDQAVRKPLTRLGRLVISADQKASTGWVARPKLQATAIVDGNSSSAAAAAGP
jgi:hypothetical protein